MLLQRLAPDDQHGPDRASLRSVVSLNGFTTPDSQLAAVLHSSINVFETLPENRPDLPVSYFSKFLFSDSYLGRVHPNLALNIYTAVSNPITLDGRLRLCRGTLLNRSLGGALANIGVPIICLQSTEDVLVAPSNVDHLLEVHYNCTPLAMTWRIRIASLHHSEGTVDLSLRPLLPSSRAAPSTTSGRTSCGPRRPKARVRWDSGGPRRSSARSRTPRARSSCGFAPATRSGRRPSASCSTSLIS